MRITPEDFLAIRGNPPVRVPDAPTPLESAYAYRAAMSQFWHEEGIDHEYIEEWVQHEAIEDCGLHGLTPAFLPFLATGYEVGFMFGWLLHKLAAERSKR